MIARRDRLNSYAVVLAGTDGPVDGERYPFTMVRVFDESKQFDLRTQYRYSANYLEHGTERVTTVDRYKWRKYPVTNYYLNVPKTRDNFLHRSFDSPIGHNPYDDWLNVFGVSTHQVTTIEQHLERHPIQDARFSDGLLVARFASLTDSHTWNLTFDPAVESMPVRGEVRNRDTNELSHELRLTWKRVAGQLLPDSIVYEYPVANRNRTVTTLHAKQFKLHWLLGKEIPQSVFAGPDHLTPLLDHFGLARSRFDAKKDMWVPVDVWTPLSLPIPDDFQELQ